MLRGHHAPVAPVGIDGDFTPVRPSDSSEAFTLNIGDLFRNVEEDWRMEQQREAQKRDAVMANYQKYKKEKLALDVAARKAAFKRGDTSALQPESPQKKQKKAKRKKYRTNQQVAALPTAASVVAKEGQVRSREADGTYTIHFADGSAAEGVTHDRIRALRATRPQTQLGHSASQAQFEAAPNDNQTQKELNLLKEQLASQSQQIQALRSNPQLAVAEPNAVAAVVAVDVAAVDVAAGSAAVATEAVPVAAAAVAAVAAVTAVPSVAPSVAIVVADNAGIEPPANDQDPAAVTQRRKQTFELGDQVLVRRVMVDAGGGSLQYKKLACTCRGQGKYYGGRIARKHLNSTYNVEFEDEAGLMATKVIPEYIRPRADEESLRRGQMTEARDVLEQTQQQQQEKAQKQIKEGGEKEEKKSKAGADMEAAQQSSPTENRLQKRQQKRQEKRQEKREHAPHWCDDIAHVESYLRLKRNRTAKNASPNKSRSLWQKASALVDPSLQELVQVFGGHSGEVGEMVVNQAAKQMSEQSMVEADVRAVVLRLEDELLFADADDAENDSGGQVGGLAGLQALMQDAKDMLAQRTKEDAKVSAAGGQLELKAKQAKSGVKAVESLEPGLNWQDWLTLGPVDDAGTANKPRPLLRLLLALLTAQRDRLKQTVDVAERANMRKGAGMVTNWKSVVSMKAAQAREKKRVKSEQSFEQKWGYSWDFAIQLKLKSKSAVKRAAKKEAKKLQKEARRRSLVGASNICKVEPSLEDEASTAVAKAAEANNRWKSAGAKVQAVSTVGKNRSSGRRGSSLFGRKKLVDNGKVEGVMGEIRKLSTASKPEDAKHSQRGVFFDLHNSSNTYSAAGAKAEPKAIRITALYAAAGKLCTSRITVPEASGGTKHELVNGSRISVYVCDQGGCAGRECDPSAWRCVGNEGCRRLTETRIPILHEKGLVIGAGCTVGVCIYSNDEDGVAFDDGNAIDNTHSHDKPIIEEAGLGYETKDGLLKMNPHFFVHGSELFGKGCHAGTTGGLRLGSAIGTRPCASERTRCVVTPVSRSTAHMLSSRLSTQLTHSPPLHTNRNSDKTTKTKQNQMNDSRNPQNFENSPW
jgi:hypothetical protein